MDKHWWPADQLIWIGDKYQKCPEALGGPGLYDSVHEPHAWMAETWHEVIEGAWIPAGAPCIQSYWCSGNWVWTIAQAAKRKYIFSAVPSESYRLTVIVDG